MLALVDDDAPLLHAMTFAFETEGYLVSGHANAEDALTAPSLPHWRCLVFDHRLPGMSGLDLIARVRAMNVTAPALIITSNPTRSTRAYAQRLGVDIIEKPLLDDILLKRVCALWRTAPA